MTSSMTCGDKITISLSKKKNRIKIHRLDGSRFVHYLAKWHYFLLLCTTVHSCVWFSNCKYKTICWTVCMLVQRVVYTVMHVYMSVHLSTFLECKGIEPPDFLNSKNIKDFEGCTSIDGNMMILTSSFTRWGVHICLNHGWFYFYTYKVGQVRCFFFKLSSYFMKY